MDILTAITLCLIVSLFLSEIFRRLRYPEVIGQILAGIFFGLPFFSGFFSSEIIVDIEFLSELGIVFLLLLAGLEINLKRLEKLSKDEFLVAALSAMMPLLLGFLAMKAIGFNNVTAIVVGASLAITSEGTTLKVLMDMKQLNTKIGTIILGAGIIDDVIEIILLAGVLILVQKPGSSGIQIKSLAFFPVMIIAFTLVCLILIKYLPKLMRYIQKEHSRTTTFSLVIIIGIGVASLSQFFGLGPIIGAFLAGVMIHWVNHDGHEEDTIVGELKVMTFAFVIPFFFIYIGLHFDYNVLFENPMMVLFIISIAIAGKMLGSIMAAAFSKDLNFKQAIVIGWGMNSRGAVELVIAELARANGLITNTIYSSIVVMAIFTTLIFPFILKAFLKKNPKIMKQ